ncbi:MAG TPA: hypothetical protein VG961_07240 [Ignavibacteria bacterium]|nr:hypothetical protein [Ignavibacteria bacterium]
MEDNEIINNTEKGDKQHQNGKFLRCINIDCIFNSSNEQGAIRNTCSHPNVVVESRFADITIAICSEFRSKKDYSFEKPATIVEVKTGEKTEIKGRPDLGIETIEKVTTKELEDDVNKPHDKPAAVEEQKSINVQDHIKPLVIESAAAEPQELTPDEIYNLSTKPGTDFLILKKLYQPNTRKGLIGSIIFHFFLLFVMYQTLVPKEEKHNGDNNQRIVVVEDLEMPKFDPPDIDKIKEEEQKLLEEQEIKDNTKDVRPKIQKKTITPNIKRPIDNTKDTNLSKLNDTNKVKNDSSLTKNPRDTNRIQIPDSLKATYDKNEIGLIVNFPKGWKLLDNRDVNLNQKEFNGVILATDSLSEDPGAVNMFLLVDDPQHSAYNKATYKNPFQMDDSLVVGYVTDPIKASGKKFSTKYYLFTDPTGAKNIQVNVDYASQAMMEKYQLMVDAVVRSIKIAPPPKKDP